MHIIDHGATRRAVGAALMLIGVALGSVPAAAAVIAPTLLPAAGTLPSTIVTPPPVYQAPATPPPVSQGMAPSTTNPPTVFDPEPRERMQNWRGGFQDWRLGGHDLAR